LKRAVREQADAFEAKTILIEDKVPGTQLIQELSREGMHTPDGDKIMRMNSVLSTIENGFVYLPEKPRWLGEYVHELASFPKGKHHDQADSGAVPRFREPHARLWPLLESALRRWHD
jgi:predicted phage terminase large subunit-like protein